MSDETLTEGAGSVSVDSQAVDRAAQERAERDALAQVFDDVRTQSADSQLVQPTRWAELGLVPAHMTPDDFEMFVYEYLEDAIAAAQEEAVRAAQVAQEGAAVSEEAVVGNVSADSTAVDDGADDNADDDRSPFANLSIPEGYKLVELEGEFVLVPTDETAEPPERIINCVGIAALVGEHSYYLYDRGIMTDAYAHWAFLAAEDNKVATLVDCVREESRVYPRPMPEQSLRNAPFRMSAEDITQTWEIVQESGAYPDIQQTIASNGDVYYFSTEYLSTAYAHSLAEWDAVERYMNV